MKKLNLGFITEKGNVINFVISRKENENFLHELNLRIKNGQSCSDTNFLIAVRDEMYNYNKEYKAFDIKPNLNQGNVDVLVKREIRYLNECIADCYN